MTIEEGDPPSRWIWSVIGWDGGLPLVVALIPELLLWLRVERTTIDLTVLIAAPMVAALVRTHHGRTQLERIGRQDFWWR